MHTPRQRQEILVRDEHCCQQCGSGECLCVHHIEYRKDGGSDDFGNLTTLCDECHSAIHRSDNLDALMRYNRLRNIGRQRVALHELYDRFIAALYGQDNLPCDLWYGNLVIFYPQDTTACFAHT